jgi:hypothetical protein
VQAVFFACSRVHLRSLTTLAIFRALSLSLSLPRSVLPEECTLQVLSFLPERDLANVALLNRQFKRLAEDDAIWRLLSMRYHTAHTRPHTQHTQPHTRDY